MTTSIQCPRFEFKTHSLFSNLASFFFNATQNMLKIIINIHTNTQHFNTNDSIRLEPKTCFSLFVLPLSHYQENWIHLLAMLNFIVEIPVNHNFISRHRILIVLEEKCK